MNTPPPILYKYLDSSGAFKTLSNQTLRFSVPTSLNDPFECLYGGIPVGYRERFARALHDAKQSKGKWIQTCQEWLGSDVSHAEAEYAYDHYELDSHIDLLIDKHISTFPKQHESLHNKTLQYFAISCFSERFENLLMWGHYTGRHTGCVMGFDTTLWSDLYKVRYSSERVPHPMLKEDSKYYVLESLRTKSTDWEYEQEWRIVRQTLELNKQDNGILVMPFPVDIIREIILGVRVDPLLDETARVFARKHSSCKLMKARIHPNEFRIVIRPYDEQEETP